MYGHVETHNRVETHGHVETHGRASLRVYVIYCQNIR